MLHCRAPTSLCAKCFFKMGDVSQVKKHCQFDVFQKLWNCISVGLRCKYIFMFGSLSVS